MTLNIIVKDIYVTVRVTGSSYQVSNWRMTAVVYDFKLSTPPESLEG